MIAEAWFAACMAFTGYQLVEMIKYTVGLGLMVAGKEEAARWWDREIIQ
jgi:hypothetical protein